VALMLIGLIICALLPQVIMWLPEVLID